MEPVGKSDDVEQFQARLATLLPASKLLLWVMAQEDDDLSAAQTRVAAWMGQPAADVGPLLARALETLFPGVEPSAACARARPLVRDHAPVQAPNTVERQSLFHRMSADYRSALDEIAHGKRPLPKRAPAVGILLATCYPTLPTPEKRLEAFRSAVARGEIDLRLKPPAPRFEDPPALGGSLQERYDSLTRSQQDKIRSLLAPTNKLGGGSSSLTLEPVTKRLLKQLLPSVTSDAKLVIALRFRSKRRSSISVTADPDPSDGKSPAPFGRQSRPNA